MFSRYFSMPSGDTFSMKPVAAFIERHVNRSGLVVDPFARNTRLADIRNDLNPETEAEFHMDAVDFLRSLAGRRDITTVLFDPPYSPRQISECYAAAGFTATMKDTQNARFYKACRDAMKEFLRPGAVVISFGWNSLGMGKDWRRLETLLVYHGGAHNDTICCADSLPGESDDQGRDRVCQDAGAGGVGRGEVFGGPVSSGSQGIREADSVRRGGRGKTAPTLDDMLAALEAELVGEQA